MGTNSKKKTLENKISSIELAAEKYAKDQNITESTVISTNKLVVMGYIQPDNSTEDGLSEIINPVNGENLICNLITIKIDKDNINVAFDEKRKNCKLSNEELQSSDISIKAFKFIDGENRQINCDSSTRICDWTRENVLLFLDVKNPEQVYSIMYEYGGETIEKTIKTKAINPSGPSDIDNIPNYYNELLINNIGQLFNYKINITYNMKDGTVKTGGITIRIDKESPTGYVITSNDLTTNANSERKVNIYLDDGAGSGIRGFYYSKENRYGVGVPFIDSNTTDANIGKLSNGSGYFYATRGKYYIYPIDKVGNVINAPIEINIENFDPADLSCSISVYKLGEARTGTPQERDNNWYNFPITLSFYGDITAGDNGYSYNYRKNDIFTNKNELTLRANLGENPVENIDESNEIFLTNYHGAVSGLSTSNNALKKCVRVAGVDLQKPTIEFSYDENTVYHQHQKVRVTITDNLSGFNPDTEGGNKKTIYYNWSTSSTGPTGDWKTTALNLSGEQNRIISGEIDDNSISSSLITGTYYFYIRGDITADKAGNTLDQATPHVSFLFDNTPPTCTNSGGSDWTNRNVTITGSCMDRESLCKQLPNDGKKTYTTTGAVKRLYDYEINSTTESPGLISDNAGNTTNCPADRTVKIDLTNPTCVSTGGGSWTRNKVTIKGTCSDKGGSNCKGNVTKDYDSQGKWENQSPGTVYDNAGNSANCPANRKVYIDRTNPNCSISKTSTGTGGVSISISCSDSGGSGVSTCAGSSGSSSTKTGLKSDHSYTVTDGAGNSGSCNVSVGSQRQRRSRSCGTHEACKEDGCKTYKYYCTCGRPKAPSCTSVELSGTGGCSSVCGFTGGCGYSENKKTCIKKKYKRDKTCDCESWNSWSSWSNVSSCSASSSKTSQVECRTVYN